MADELGTNLPVLSMAWILQHPEISCVIAGASKPSQLENNMKAAGFVIPADAMAEIDKITGFHRFERHVGSDESETSSNESDCQAPKSVSPWASA